MKKYVFVSIKAALLQLSALQVLVWTWAATLNTLHDGQKSHSITATDWKLNVGQSEMIKQFNYNLGQCDLPCLEILWTLVSRE